MAKHTAGKGGSAHIRLIVLDAVIPEGDVGQLTQALQNALRPVNSDQQKISSSARQVPQNVTSSSDATEEVINNSDELEIGNISTSRRPAKDARVRRFPSPKLLDLTPEQVSSWKKFAGAKSPKNDSDRYVLVVAWFLDNGASDGVTADHIFTCFRQIKWSVAIDDFGALLRSLKATNHLKSLGRGKYAVTQVGLQRIDDMETVSGSE